MKDLPNRGHIGIFNRSYYEEVLVVRVHPEFLAKQKMPPKLISKRIWERRFEDIRDFEQSVLEEWRGGAEILSSRFEKGTGKRRIP